MMNSQINPVWQNVGQCERMDTEPPPVSDHALALKAAGGDTHAFEELYQRYYGRVYRLCLHMTGNAEESENLAQEVFQQLHREIGSFHGDAAFTTWLHRLSVNHVIIYLRHHSIKLEKTPEEKITPLEIVIEPVNTDGVVTLECSVLDHAVA